MCGVAAGGAEDLSRAACNPRAMAGGGTLRKTPGPASEVPGHVYGSHDQKAGSGEAGGGSLDTVV